MFRQELCNEEEHHATTKKGVEDERGTRKEQGQTVHLEGDVVITPYPSK